MAFSPRHILVPLALDANDDPRMASKAVDAACALALKFGSRVTLVHFATVPSPPKADGNKATDKIYSTLAMLLEQRLESGKEAIAKLEERARSQGVTVESSVVDVQESVAHAICHFGEHKQADMIVIGSHSRHGLKRLLLGSVAERVVHLASVDVLLVRTH